MHHPQSVLLKLQMPVGQRLGFGIQPLPAGGKLSALTATVKQPGPQQCFQRLYLFAQRRLSNAQPLRSQTIIALLGQHHESAQLFYIHSTVLSI